MATKAREREPESKFNVVSVERTDPPEGCTGDNWYRYVIGRGRSTIVGARSGTLKQVTAHAKEYADDLNWRAANGGGSTWSPRGRKKAAHTSN